MKPRFFTFLLSLTALSGFCISADPNPKQKMADSLRSIINRDGDPMLTAKAYYDLSELFYGSDSDSMRIFCEKGLLIVNAELEKEEKKKEKQLLRIKSDILNNLGYVYSIGGDVSKGLEYNEQSLMIREKLGDKDAIANSLNNIAIIYDEQGNTGKALDYYHRGLKMLEATGEKYGMGFLLNNIAYVYLNHGDTEKALEYFTRSQKMRMETKDDFGLAENLNNIGLILLDRGETEKARNNFEKALEITSKGDFKKGMSVSYSNLGKVYIEEGDYEKAMECFREMLKIQELTKDKRSTVNAYMAMGQVEQKRGRLDAALIHGKKAFQIAKELQYPEVIRSSAEILTEIYKQKGDYRLALEMHELYVLMRDSVNREDNKKATVQKEFQYIYEKKATADSVRNAEQSKLKELKYEQEIKQQRAYTYGGILGFILMVLVAAITYAGLRNKKRAHLLIARQKKLVEEKQQEIIASITYAKRIQQSHMPTERYIQDSLRRLKRD